MAEVINVILNKSDTCSGLGFSLLGTPGFPPVIYDIIENSPAAESGKVEAGDVILKINETDVIRCNTKEVLKCLRLSQNPVSLELKRDPEIKDKVRHILSSPNCYPDENGEVVCTQKSVGNVMSSDLDCDPPSPSSNQHPPSLHTVQRSNGDAMTTTTTTTQGSQPKCEAFMMTGDRVLKLTRDQQVSLLPKYQKKIDSLCKNNYHYHNNNNNSNHSCNRHNSVPTSPSETEKHEHNNRVCSANSSPSPSPILSPQQQVTSYSVRSSKSEDHIHKNSRSTMNVDFEEDDVMSSLNTLLDTRPDSDPRSNPSSSVNNSLSSPTSPTSVSSSVMSSNSNSASANSTERKRAFEDHAQQLIAQESLSQSEGISNISSPDFVEGDSGILNARDLVMQVSDPSDSDSTLLVCEPKVRRTSGHLQTSASGNCLLSTNNNNNNNSAQPNSTSDHRIVIQVKSGTEKKSIEPINNSNNIERRPPDVPEDVIPCDNNIQNQDSSEEIDDPQLIALAEGAAKLARSISQDTTTSDDSDLDSLQSFHFSPKAVDYPSALRLAKRLYHLDGFKKSDVSRHLSKNNDFSRVVAEEYLKYFKFDEDSLDIALRKFLKQFCLIGETQERERVLVHFSKRYLDCNPGSFKSQDAVHTLTCAIMLLNTDLHAQIIGRKMTCTEFVENLAELNDGENFPREILKQLYHAIKNNPLEWAVDDEEPALTGKGAPGSNESFGLSNFGFGGKDEIPQSAVEYKKGYVMRKCCIDPNGKKTPLGKRGWKMYYCTLRDLVLYLHKDENGFRKNQFSDNVHNAIRIHHALATKATDYKKKQHVFKLETVDRAEYLFQTSDSKELQSWIDTINFVCASLSAQPLPGGIGSQKKFQRPLLPSSHTRLNLREQMKSHEDMTQHLQQELDQHKPPDKHAKGLILQNYKEKHAFLLSEIRRYNIYAIILNSKLNTFHSATQQQTSSMLPFDNNHFSLMFPPAHLTLHETEMSEEEEHQQNSSPNRHQNRYSYRAAIYGINELP